jgi:hypothetical protein
LPVRNVIVPDTVRDTPAIPENTVHDVAATDGPALGKFGDLNAPFFAVNVLFPKSLSTIVTT